MKRLKCNENFEVVIVNDGSQDDTEALLKNYIYEEKNFNIKVISIKNSGRSYARNTGIRFSKGNLIIFSDDDLILDPRFLSFHSTMHKLNDKLIVHGQILSLPYLKFFKNPTTGELYDGGFAKNRLMDKIITPEMFSNGKIEKYLKSNAKMSKFEKDIMTLFECTSIHDSYVRWIGFTGGNVSILRSNISYNEMFDINMGRKWGCEDLEMGYRLYRKGLSFIYCKQARNYHINHYRDNYMDIHNNSLQYFIEKHNDELIALLKNYFNGSYSSLVDWKKDRDILVCKNEPIEWME